MTSPAPAWLPSASATAAPVVGGHHPEALEPAPDPPGQLRGLLVGWHDQQRRTAPEPVGEVAVGRGGEHVLLAALDQPPVRVVLAEHLRVPVAQAQRRRPLPVVVEADDLVEGEGRDVAGELPQRPAGADRVELGVVAGEQHFGPAVLGDRPDAVQGLGGGHAGLVDDQQGAGLEFLGGETGVGVGFVAGQEPGEVDGVQTVLDEHVGGDLRGREAEHAPPVVGPPRLGQRPDGERLPGARRADQHVDRPVRGEDPQQRRPLARGEPGPVRAAGHRGETARGHGRRPAGAGCSHQPVLGRELPGGGVALGHRPGEPGPAVALAAQRRGGRDDLRGRQRHHPGRAGRGERLGEQPVDDRGRRRLRRLRGRAVPGR